MPFDYTSGASSRLISQLITTTTTGVTLQQDQVNTNYTYAAWPTGQHKIMLKRKVENTTYMESCIVASATQNSTTGVVTLGTLTRNISATDGTDLTGSAATVTWPSGTLVYVSWDNTDAQLTMKVNEVNTITGAGAIRGSSTTVALIRPNSVTTTQRDAITAANGDMVYNSTTNQLNSYAGGAWGATGSTTVADGSTTVAGKYEEATVAEQGTATATGSTGARLVPAVANLVKTSSGAGDENKIAVLGASGTFPIGMLATGTPTGSKFIRDDGTLQTVSSGDFVKLVFMSTTNSAIAGASSASQVNIDTHTYAVPANDLISGVGYEFRCYALTRWISGTTKFAVRLGTVDLATATLSPTADNNLTIITGTIYGTAAAGASVAVMTDMNVTMRQVGVDTLSVNGVAADEINGIVVATNAQQTLQFSVQYSASDASHSVIMRRSNIKKISTTAF